jgi:hypothetical protein
MPLTCKRRTPAFLILCVPALLSLSIAKAQCTATGITYPGTVTSVSFSGSDFPFSNPSNAISSDNSRASSAALLSLLSGQTEYLQATHFGFSIPSTAIICGIEVQVEKSAAGIGNIFGIEVSYATDHVVRLVRNGAVAGNNKASPAHWTSSEAWHTYGSNTDLWGVAWTTADINASNFGIAFAASVTGVASLIPNVLIDNIRLTVYYYESLLSLTTNHTPKKSTVKTGSTTVKAYPNPCTSYVVISGCHPADPIILRNALGEQIPVNRSVTGSKTCQLSLNHLQPGIYFIQAGNVIKKIQKR